MDMHARASQTELCPEGLPRAAHLDPGSHECGTRSPSVTTARLIPDACDLCRFADGIRAETRGFP